MDAATISESKPPAGSPLRNGIYASLAFIVLLGIPAALILFLIPKYYEIKTQLMAFHLGCALAIVGLAWSLWDKVWPWRRGNAPALICLGAGLLIAGTVVWNIQFMDCVKRPDNRNDEAFRSTLQKLHSPAYGNCTYLVAPEGTRREKSKQVWAKLHWQKDEDQATKYCTIYCTAGLILTTLLMAGLYLAVGRWRWLGGWRWIAALMAFQFVMTLLVAGADPTIYPNQNRASDSNPGRLTDPYFASYAMFFGDLDKPVMPHTTLAILRNWTQMMPRLSAFDQHYPPGILLFLNKCLGWGKPGLSKWIVMLATLLTLPALAGVCRELGLRGRGMALPLVLFASCPGTVNFPTVSPVILLMPLGMLGLWLWIGALRRDSRNWALAAGAVFAVCGLFSMTLSLELELIAIATLLWIVRGECRFTIALRAALWSALTFAGVFVLLDVTTGFNFLECIRVGLSMRYDDRHYEPLALPGAVERYLLTSTGNILAYVLMNGIVLSALALTCAARLLVKSRRPDTAPPDDAPMAKSLAAALAATLLLAGFGRLYHLETERIWIILTPVLALLAGIELHHHGQNEGRGVVVIVLLLCLAATIAQCVIFMPYL